MTQSHRERFQHRGDLSGNPCANLYKDMIIIHPYLKGEAMKQSTSKWLAGGVVAVPAYLSLVSILSSFKGEYYFSTYVIVGVVFVAASFVAGTWAASRIQVGASRWGSFGRLFAGSLAAWTVSLIVLGLLSLTPLCVGQNNGDGINDIGACGFYVVLAAVFYSVPMIPLMSVACGVATFLMR